MSQSDIIVDIAEMMRRKIGMTIETRGTLLSFQWDLQGSPYMVPGYINQGIPVVAAVDVVDAALWITKEFLAKWIIVVEG